MDEATCYHRAPAPDGYGTWAASHLRAVGSRSVTFRAGAVLAVGASIEKDSPVPEQGKIAEKSPPRWILKFVSKAHVFLNRLTGGRAFNTLSGMDVCFVVMTGAKSGRRITMPLMYVPHQDGVLLVASQGGAPKNPVWYHNLVKHPDIEVLHRTRHMTLRARLASAEEKPALWPICDAFYPPYADYRARTTRDIPVFICEARG
jgi:F420H(2)-dependent quinone reductase